MMMDEWRRTLLRLQQEERAAREALAPGLDPLDAERAYEALQAAQRALEDHYAIRPAGN